MDIIKPNNDNRIYKYFILDNNIKCILINDNSLDKSYVVTSVNVGSFANKEYYDGIAHLLEHMCFITSKKYKIKNYLAKKVAEFGGATNAFTAENNTIYYLDVFKNNLEEILEIFIDFLVNAELKEEYILNEIENVDAEHKKNLFSDNWRLYNLEKILGNSKSNYNNFSTGTKETLNKSDIYNKIVDFYKKYYTSNNISICIASNYSIGKLYEIVNNSFGSIKKSNIKNDTKLIRPLYTTNKGKQFIMKSHGSSKILTYIFETPENIIESKIFNLFINIVTSPEENLCVDHLKLLGYIDHIYGEYELYGLLKVKVILTEKGLDNILYIDNFMYNFFNEILDFNWFDIFENEKKRQQLLFDNCSKIDTMDLCTDFLLKLPIYDPKDVYYSDNYYSSVNKKDIDILKKHIKVEDCVRILLTDKFNINNKLLIDPNYKTEYYETTIFNNSKENITIKYNSTNPYTNISPIFIKNLNIEPYKIKKNYWYGATSKFKEYNVYFNVIFSKKEYFDSPINTLLTIISIKILNYYLYNKLYKAIEYNFNASFNINDSNNIIELNLYTLNDVKYIQKFINDVFNIILNKIEVSDELIKSIISIVKDHYINIKTMNSWEFCNYIFDNMYENSHYYLDLLDNIDKITIPQIKKYMLNLFNDAGMNVIVYGNIKISDLPNFDQLDMSNKLCKFQKISIKKNIIKIHPNIDEKSNCVKLSYFIGKFNPLKNLHLLFLQLMSYNIFFEDLRTTKKLGYLVVMSGSIISNEYYIYQKVQSELSCDKIIEHIKIFNSELIDKIKKEDFNKWIQTVTNHLKEKETNNNELYNKYYSEIYNRTYMFKRKEMMLKHINDISLKSLINFINKNLLNNKKSNIIQIKHK